MNAFQMLVILGFPPAVAAASVAPETFRREANETITAPKAPASN